MTVLFPKSALKSLFSFLFWVFCLLSLLRNLFKKFFLALWGKKRIWMNKQSDKDMLNGRQANNFVWWWSAYRFESSPEIIVEVQRQNSQVIKGLLSPPAWGSDKENYSSGSTTLGISPQRRYLPMGSSEQEIQRMSRIGNQLKAWRGVGIYEDKSWG